jgi:hypothetical protein
VSRKEEEHMMVVDSNESSKSGDSGKSVSGKSFLGDGKSASGKSVSENGESVSGDGKSVSGHGKSEASKSVSGKTKPMEKVEAEEKNPKRIKIVGKTAAILLQDIARKD